MVVEIAITPFEGVLLYLRAPYFKLEPFAM